MKKWQRLIGRLLVFLSFAGAMSIIVYVNVGQISEKTLEGQRMPDIQGEAWNQTEIDWKATDGRAKLIYFYEPQCTHCLDQIEMFHQYHREGAFEEIDVVTVTTEKEKALHRLYNTNGWYIRTVIDDGRWKETFRPKQIPTLIVINKQGQMIRYIEKRIHPENMALILKSIS